MTESGAEMLQTIANHLWRASWEGSLLVVAVVGLQWLLRRWVPARWLTALWVIVLLRLVMPALPEIPWSVSTWLREAFLTTPPLVSSPRRYGRVPLPDWIPESTPSLPITLEPPSTPTVGRQFSAASLFCGLWATVSLALMARMIVIHFRWVRRAVRERQQVPGDVQELFNAIQARLRIKRAELLLTPVASSPLVTGLWRPRVCLPAGLERNLSLEELRMVFWHELAHIKRGDTWLAWWSGVAVSLHWFNPVIHLAMARARQDRELACDEWVLEHGQNPRVYGAALVRILEFGFAPAEAVGAVAVEMLGTKAALFHRMRRISAHQPSSWRGALGGASILAVLGVCTLTGSGGERSQVRDGEKAAAEARSKAHDMSSTFAALRDFYEQEAKIWTLRGREQLGGSLPWHDESELRLTNDSYRFAIRQVPEAVKQGTGDYAPCPPALYEAIDDRSPAKVRALLRTIAAPNLPTNDERNIFEPIDYTVHALVVKPEDLKLREIVKVLLAFGADPASARIDRRSVLFAPVKNGQLDLVAFLLSSGIDPRKGGDGGAAVMEEAELRGTPAMKSLVRKEFDKSADAYGASKLW